MDRRKFLQAVGVLTVLPNLLIARPASAQVLVLDGWVLRSEDV